MFNIYKKITRDHPQSVYAQITVFSDPCMHLSREKGQFYRDCTLFACSLSPVCIRTSWMAPYLQFLLFTI